VGSPCDTACSGQKAYLSDPPALASGHGETRTRPFRDRPVNQERAGRPINSALNSLRLNPKRPRHPSKSLPSPNRRIGRSRANEEAAAAACHDGPQQRRSRCNGKLHPRMPVFAVNRLRGRRKRRVSERSDRNTDRIRLAMRLPKDRCATVGAKVKFHRVAAVRAARERLSFPRRRDILPREECRNSECAAHSRQ